VLGIYFLFTQENAMSEKSKTGEVVQLNSVGHRMSVANAPVEVAHASCFAGISSEKAAFPFDAVIISQCEPYT
jgi:uncharacterized protein YodC (DUF2158 family)